MKNIFEQVKEEIGETTEAADRLDAIQEYIEAGCCGFESYVRTMAIFGDDILAFLAKTPSECAETNKRIERQLAEMGLNFAKRNAS